MKPSRALEISEELFERILWHALQDCYAHDRKERQHLSALSLVCRYWACQRRQTLFRCIMLRTPDGARRFYEMLRVPALPGLPAIAAMTHGLGIEAQDIDSEPWFHLVFLLLPKLQEVQLAYLQPCPTGGRWPWRTLHPFLPRCIPGSLMPIHWLSFHGAHVHSRSTILHLVSTIPLLQTLEVLNITYNIAEDFRADASPLWDFRQRKFLAFTDDHQLCLALIPSSIAKARFGPTHSGLRSRSIIHREDVKTLRDLFAIFAGVKRFKLEIEAEVSGEAGES